MDTITLDKQTLYSLLDIDLFTLFYQDEITDSVCEAAKRDGTDIYSFLACKFPDSEITSENAGSFMAKVFVDKLANNGIVI